MATKTSKGFRCTLQRKRFKVDLWMCCKFHRAQTTAFNLQRQQTRVRNDEPKFKDRLSTWNIIRRRRQMHGCVLCDLDVEETSHHLFLRYQFAKQCWELTSVHIPLAADLPWCNDMSQRCPSQNHTQFFMAAIILLCWATWGFVQRFHFHVFTTKFTSLSGNFFQGTAQLMNQRVSLWNAETSVINGLNHWLTPSL